MGILFEKYPPLKKKISEKVSLKMRINGRPFT